VWSGAEAKANGLVDMLGSFEEEERKIIQTNINKGYENFTSKAAEGRKMDLIKLKSLASGRVWSGAEAKANGLVDMLGSFEDAVKLAAQKAKLKEGDYRLRFLPVQKDFFDKINDIFNVQAKTEKNIQSQLGELYPILMWLKKLKKQDFLQTRMEYDLIIQ
jgi:protease-4